MNLSLGSADDRAVESDDDEQVLGVEPVFLILVDDLNVSQPLRIGADFILTFDNKNPVLSQDPMRFPRCLKVQIHDSRMPFRLAIGRLTIGVGVPEGGMRALPCHVRC